MIDWLRRVDPAFYHKEPQLLRTQAQIARYTDDAQAEVRLTVLTADWILHTAITIIALSAYAVATGAGALDPRSDWPTVWALVVLAVAAPRALPWWPRDDGNATWRHALIGIALVAIPAIWFHLDWAVAGTALLAGVTLYVARDRARLALLVLAVGVLFAVRTPPYLLWIAPIVGALAAGAVVLAVSTIAGVWRSRPQVVTWSAFAGLLAVFAYTLAFEAPVIALRVPVAITALALAYLGVCIIAGRVRRAELMARPDGVLSIPQVIVPLLDRSHNHAVICWLE